MQLVRWGSSPPDTRKPPTHHFRLHSLEARDFLDRLNFYISYILNITYTLFLSKQKITPKKFLILLYEQIMPNLSK